MKKNERHEIYKNAYKYFMVPYRMNSIVFLCTLIKDQYIDNGFGSKSKFERNKSKFEELFSFKPDIIHNNDKWFSHSLMSYLKPEVKEHQEMVLLFCIEMTR